MIAVGSSAVEGLIQACSVHRSVARLVSIAVFLGSTCSCDLSVALTAIFICSVGSSGSGVGYHCQQVCYRLVFLWLKEFVIFVALVNQWQQLLSSG